MPIERFFDEDDIKTLIDMNAAPPYGPRNAALILAASYWGLTPFELTLLRLEDVMDASGEFFRIWTLPAHVAYTGEARELHTADHVLPILDEYMAWWNEKDLFGTALVRYRGRGPKAPFIINDKYAAYTLSGRPEKGYIANSMNRKLKHLIANTSIEGATPATFRDSFIRMMYQAGCGYKELMDITGIKQKETIDKKVKPHTVELKKIYSNVFRNVL